MYFVPSSAGVSTAPVILSWIMAVIAASSRSVKAPLTAPEAAPSAAPASGIKKIRPISVPQKAPPTAPAAVVLIIWFSLIFLFSSFTATTASPNSSRYSFCVASSFCRTSLPSPQSEMRLRRDHSCDLPPGHCSSVARQSGGAIYCALFFVSWAFCWSSFSSAAFRGTSLIVSLSSLPLKRNGGW